MALESVYWLALGIGLGMLVISVVLGEIFDLLPDFLSIEIGGGDFAAAPVFFAATAAFGAGGLLGIHGFELGRGGSIATGIGVGVGAGALTGLLFVVLGRQEATDGFELSKLIGQRGRCSLAVAPTQVGRVTVTYAGMTRSFSAQSTESIAVGQEVVVRDVIGSMLSVSRPVSTGEPGAGMGRGQGGAGGW